MHKPLNRVYLPVLILCIIVGTTTLIPMGLNSQFVTSQKYTNPLFIDNETPLVLKQNLTVKTSVSGLSYYWHIYFLNASTALCNLRVEFQEEGNYTLQIAIPFTARQIRLLNYTFVHYQLKPQEPSYRLLQVNISNSYSFFQWYLDYYWNPCVTFPDNRTYFSGFESFVPAPQLYYHNNYQPLQGIIDIDNISARDISAFTFFNSEPNTINKTLFAYRLYFEDPYYLPQFSYFSRTSQSQQYTALVGHHTRITCLAPLSDLIVNATRILDHAYSQIRFLLNRGSPLESLNFIILPTQRFYEVTPLSYSSAFYNYADNRIYLQLNDVLALQQNRTASMQVVLHEMVHGFTRDLGVAGIPSLFLEGWAEFYSWRIMRNLGYLQAYDRHAQNAKNQINFFCSHNSFTSIWDWNLQAYEIPQGYALAWWIVDSIVNATDEQLFTRFFSSSSTGWPILGRVGRIPYLQTGSWSLFVYYLSLAAGKSLESLFFDFDCPIASYSPMIYSAILSASSFVSILIVLLVYYFISRKKGLHCIYKKVFNTQHKAESSLFVKMKMFSPHFNKNFVKLFAIWIILTSSVIAPFPVLIILIKTIVMICVFLGIRLILKFS